MEEEEVRGRLALFTPDGNRQWKVMPMGDLNAAPTFVVMMMKVQMNWDTLARECGLKNVASNIFFDDVLLYGRIAGQLLDYFRTVLYVLKHHCGTLKLKTFK